MGDGGEAGGGDGLADAFAFFVGQVDLELLGVFGEVLVEDGLGLIDDDIGAFPGGDAAEEEDVLILVELGVEGKGIAEVDADGGVDFFCAGVVLFHELLDEDEFFREGHFFRGGDTGGLEESADGLLGEVEGSDALVFGPFIDGAMGLDIDGGEGEFIEPAGDMALGVEVTGGLAGAHGDAEDSVDAECHGGGQGGDIAVVGDFERDVPGLLEAVEEGADFGIEEILGDGAEEGGDLDLVVHIDPCGAASDGIDTGEVFGGELESFVDGFEVDFGVGLVFGVPAYFGGEDCFPVLDGGEFVVTGAEVEA